MEESWRLKSRALWLKAGDNNTRYFQNYANQRRLNNSIWDLTIDGSTICDQISLKVAALNHFKDVFTLKEKPGMLCQLETVLKFPWFFSPNDCAEIDKVVENNEVLVVLNDFARDKSPGPDGWTTEFFLHFFDLIGDEVTMAINETKTSASVPSFVNSTFVTLIPKKDRPVSFNDFRPISLCNLFYNIVAKIIVVRIKPFLGKCISEEQFGFLPCRQILDDVGVAQEGLHSIKTKNLEATILKLDLVKAYDRIDWDYLRLILVQIGLSAETVGWIMAYVTSAGFAVLINGSPSTQFQGNCGIRQGCPLSAYLFVLVIEGLSLLIKDAKNKGLIRRVKVAGACHTTHALFMDDVLLFGEASVLEWQTYNRIISTFCKASDMEVSVPKSALIHHISKEDIFVDLRLILPYQWMDIDEGFRYLGFFLKSNCYLKSDWHWLVSKVHNRIHVWSSRCLSLGGRLTLLTSVLQGLPVYWFSLFLVPAGVIALL